MEEDNFEPKPQGKIKRFFGECVRVLKVTKKPSKEDFKTIVKVSALWILVIGFVGFVVHLIYRLITGGSGGL